uniref:Phaiodotoxin n=1 Tax=Anuroctonus phaiodactylus TaxID=246982 RepID=SCX1_ANUPH|nr:RecName: Full=Phaiodotoxin; Flags: Precursor [Anuroctonus phaiodactylus]AAW29437.1 insect toxin-like phaidotoxin [Anuroctonus phaiodactylus]
MKTIPLLFLLFIYFECDGKFIRHKDESFYECGQLIGYQQYCVDACQAHGSKEKGYCKGMAPFGLPGGCYCPKLPSNRVKMCFGALESKCA